VVTFAAHHARELARERKAEPRAAVATHDERIGLGESWNSFACSFGTAATPSRAQNLISR
jgi:hypothetical protein